MNLQLLSEKLRAYAATKGPIPYSGGNYNALYELVKMVETQ